jgi:hypothetical protein
MTNVFLAVATALAIMLTTIAAIIGNLLWVVVWASLVATCVVLLLENDLDS